MKKLNRRTKVLILTVIMAVVLIGIYALGILIPESRRGHRARRPQKDQAGRGFLLTRKADALTNSNKKHPAPLRAGCNFSRLFS